MAKKDLMDSIADKYYVQIRGIHGEHTETDDGNFFLSEDLSKSLDCLASFMLFLSTSSKNQTLIFKRTLILFESKNAKKYVLRSNA